jgi:hypothetical protein
MGARRYNLVDLGTFGGPISYGPLNGNGERLLNHAGTVSSYADSSTSDPNAPDLTSQTLSKFENAFNGSKGDVRVVVLLSPT